MDWKFTGAEPVYLQIMEHFRCAVLSGLYPRGEKIPSVRELATQARVNPNTMQRALSELEREGLLVSLGTLGRYVTDNEMILGDLRRNHQQSIVRRCRALLADVGLTLRQAAQMEEDGNGQCTGSKEFD